MANRRKFLAGLGALASGSAAAMGTGAFTSVQANRQVSVNTAGDANAYLGLSGDDEYVSDDSAGGELTIDLGSPDNLGAGPTGSGDAETEGDGFNNSAITTLEGIITVTNQGTKDVRPDFAPDGDKFDSEQTVDLPNAKVMFMIPTNSKGVASFLSPGDSMKINARVDTTDDADGDGGSDDELTIYAHDRPFDDGPDGQ
ncbi:hypothetical protein ABNG02_11875 [Halorubrum ejinorense]|uniref:DUF1102 domain-containing protein n=1 Tax=Halorubrum ejinorense TaxID=425309 RepID=A0AAV3SQB3_9EURY